MALLDDVATYLASQSVGTVGTTLFKGWMPATPIDCWCLYEYAGQEPVTAHDGATIHRPGLQVMTRNKVYATGRTNAQSAADALHACTSVANTELILANQEPYSLGVDASGHFLISQNFSVIKQ